MQNLCGFRVIILLFTLLLEHLLCAGHWVRNWVTMVIGHTATFLVFTVLRVRSSDLRYCLLGSYS